VRGPAGTHADPYGADLRQDRKSAGVCQRCGKRDAARPYSECEVCRKRRRKLYADSRHGVAPELGSLEAVRALALVVRP
jgi:hypothetical protein